MYRRILVPLDGSPLAERVLPYAIALARRASAHVILFQAQTEPLIRRIDPWAGSEQVMARERPGDPAAAEPDITAAAYLDRLAAHLTEQGVSAASLVGDGHAGDTIVATAREQGVDLLAMCTHGRSGPGRWLHGSVADHVLRHTDVPIFLVTPGCPQSWEPAAVPTVLVPLDGSALAQAALSPACRLAEALGAALLLVQAIEPVIAPETVDLPMEFALDPARLLAAARDDLERIATDLRGEGYTVTTHVESGYAPAVIMAAARAYAASVIAMATHGRSGLARLALGSVATAALQHATVPLLLVRPTAHQEREALDWDAAAPTAPPLPPPAPHHSLVE